MKVMVLSGTELYFNQNSHVICLLFLRIRFNINMHGNPKTPLYLSSWGKQLVLRECFLTSKYFLYSDATMLEIPQSEMFALVLYFSCTHSL